MTTFTLVCLVISQIICKNVFLLKLLYICHICIDGWYFELINIYHFNMYNGISEYGTCI